ncbi:hypothetical protein D3C80_1586390 [compost metagenome]
MAGGYCLISQLMRQNALISDFGGGDCLLYYLGRPYRSLCQLYKCNTPVCQMMPVNLPVGDMRPVYALRA